MKTATNREDSMGYDETSAARWWDSERRDSPYSTVADPNEDDYCEECDSTVVYHGPSDRIGTCECDGGRP